MTAGRCGPPALAAVLALLLDNAGAFRGGANGITSSGSAAAGVQIAAYIINLDERPDRCKCMQRQLEGQAWPLNRQSANGECPGLPKATEIVHPAEFAVAERSLFCQNYQIWLDASKSDGEHVIILEDDALLADDFFDRVHSLVTTCQEFDYMLVDPLFFNADGATEHPKCPGVFKRERGFWTGTAVQIIRKAFLPTLIQKAELVGWGALDVWWQTFLANNAAYGWLGGVQMQASVGNWQPIERRLQELKCDWSVTSSDIGMGSHHPSDHKKDGKGMTWRKGAIHPLVCVGP